MQFELSHAVRLVGWEPHNPVQAGRWGRALVWRIFGGRMEVQRVVRHGTCYLTGARQIQLDIVTPEDWIIEVKTGSGRIGFGQISRYTRARVEGRFIGVFAAFVSNPLTGTIGPTRNDMRLLEKFAWPFGKVEVFP